MSEENLEPLSQLGKSLLELERTREAPPLQDAVWAKLGNSLGFPPDVPGVGEIPKGPVGPVASKLMASKVFLGIVMLSVGGFVGAALVHFSEKQADSKSVVPEVIVEEEPHLVLTPTASRQIESEKTSLDAGIQKALPEQKPQGKPLPAHLKQGAVASAPIEEKIESNLPGERALLEVARSALARGNTSEALVALGQHAKEFPNGQMGEERESLWISCLVNSGQSSEARLKADEFRRHFPRSILLPAVEAVIESIPVTDFDAHPK